MKKRTDYFPKYHQLNFFEKFVLNTCCYFPPKPRRERGKLKDIDIDTYEKTFKRAFGKEIFDELEGKTVLDFGCGEGGFSLALASKLKNAQIDGIDLIDGFEAANDLIEEKQLNNVRLLKMHSSKLDGQRYDYVISHDSFEHFEDPKYILSEMIRLVKPNGYLLIKFGPVWKGPYGRHIGGTLRKDRPWLHLIVPEKTIMRVHSVYHNKEELLEHYKDLEGGLNKMTVKKAFKIFKSFDEIDIVDKKIYYVFKGKLFKNVPYINELFSGSVYVKLLRK